MSASTPSINETPNANQVARDLVALFERGSDNSTAGAAVDPVRIKSAMTEVFLDSGLLEALVQRIVRRELDTEASPGLSSPDIDTLKSAAGRMVKAFLAENLGTLLREQVEGVVRETVADVLAGEGVKELVDDKFRAVTLYMTTDVIPDAVRKTLASIEADRA